MSIEKLLIANRGEIACRIIRTARSLGIRTVAVYSDADEKAQHVQQADEAVHIGPSPASESYLVADKIIDAAKTTRADAIHPGYGFLSENAAFAKAVADAGLTFIGPPAKAIRVMGDKAEAKRAMVVAGVPCIPGYEEEDQSAEKFISAADAIGFPVMVKAAAGGGGRGMRLVRDEPDLNAALKLARSEAESAFGCGDLILEKAIEDARHVEIQIFADSHGNTVHLGERDCSVQRRHQKIIEEAPCPVMTDALRARMGEAAVKAAKTVNYVGAGTVEFLLDQDGEFYFLEMNTRLQVEHPVTEEITGIDLVALQIDIADGKPLPFKQADLEMNGHAIEVRLCAEDPASDFLPSTGTIELWKRPSGDHVRVDDGIDTGDEVSPHYDSMVAKIIAHGETREDARIRLLSALEQTVLFGPASNRDFLIEILQDETFVSGSATTFFLEHRQKDKQSDSSTAIAIAAAADWSIQSGNARSKALNVHSEQQSWAGGIVFPFYFDYSFQGQEVTAIVSGDASSLSVSVDGEIFDLSIDSQSDGHISIIVGGETISANVLQNAQMLYLATDKTTLTLFKIDHLDTDGAQDGSDGIVRAPMHGSLLKVDVAVGDQIAAGDQLAVFEAMKMQHEILAPANGTVAEIPVEAGTQLAAGDAIIILENSDASA
ncbi:MAG: acetyl-CoA carboxylase biotin carboxylase subunit [Pseudomonadota bacterium]